VKPPANVPRLRDYLQLLKDGWIVIVCATALSVGAGWLARQTTDPVYQATTRVFAVTSGGAEVTDAYYGNFTAMAWALNYPQLARSPQVTMRTIEQLGLHQTPADLASHITVGVANALIEIDVTGTDPNVTRDTANVVTYSLIQLTREIQELDTAGTDLVLVDAANSVSDKRGPLARFLVLGGVFGLALSTLLVIAHGLLRDSVLGRDHVGHIVDNELAGRTT
jgi:capsular polysaccharide biosynthesis protein